MAIEKSKLNYPNKMARLFVESVEETIGSEAMRAVYNTAGVPSNLYPPPNNLAKEFDFAYFSALVGTIDQMYGGRGGRGLALHAGRAGFAGGLGEYGPVMGISDLAFKAIPLRAKLKVGLKAFVETFNKFSDQITSVTDAGDHFVYTIHQCPVCWGRTSPKPICYVSVGLIIEGLRWVSGGRTFGVEEVACHAAGDEFCVFHVPKEPED